MKSKIDIIVEDICATDPTLGEDVVLLRQIIEELIEHKPAVQVDDAFKARLRQELLESVSAQAVITPSPYPWWLLYTVPFGVTAVLFLLLQPDLLQAPQNMYEVPMTPADSMLKMDERVSDESASIMAPQSDMGDEQANYSADIFTVSASVNQAQVMIEYISLSRPGYVLISSVEGVVAVSSIIETGESEGVTINLNVPLAKEVIYTAMLYYDNGDGVYVEGEEELAVGQDGQSLSVMFGVTN